MLCSPRCTHTLMLRALHPALLLTTKVLLWRPMAFLVAFQQSRWHSSGMLSTGLAVNIKYCSGSRKSELAGILHWLC